MEKLTMFLSRILPEWLKTFLKKYLNATSIYLGFLALFKKIWHKYLMIRKIKIRSYLRKHEYRVLHIGCNINQYEDFLNTDLTHGIYLNITEKFPLPDRSMDVIFHEHLIEHIKFPHEIIFSLTEQYRVLKKGGVLRLATPNFKEYSQAYLEGSLLNFERFSERLKEDKYYSKVTAPMEVMNHIIKMNGEHHFVFDFESLKYMLKEVGFKNIKKKKVNQSSIKGWDKDWWDEKGTMYIECKK